MNRRAAALGLADTHYANPVGLDQRGNYSSARDLATLTRRLLRIPAFARIAASRHAVLRSVHPPRRISTINELLEMAPWVNGVKTGHTFDAGYVLVGSGRREGVELISVAIGAPTDEDRFADNLRAARIRLPPVPAPARRSAPARTLADPSIRYSGGELPLRAARSVTVGLRRGQRLSVEVERSGARSRGRSAAEPRSAGRPSSSTACAPGAFALRAGRAIPAAERLRPGPRLRRRTPDSHRPGDVRDTDGRGTAVSLAVPSNDQGERSRVNAK